jgi:hypothetical protein
VLHWALAKHFVSSHAAAWLLSGGGTRKDGVVPTVVVVPPPVACPSVTAAQVPNKQLERTVQTRRGDAASAPFHYALAARYLRQRAAAQLRRYAA